MISNSFIRVQKKDFFEFGKKFEFEALFPTLQHSNRRTLQHNNKNKFSLSTNTMVLSN